MRAKRDSAVILIGLIFALASYTLESQPYLPGDFEARVGRGVLKNGLEVT